MAESSFGRIALLSIHPRHAEAILAGTKRVELRRSPLADDTTHAVIYATAPVAAVVGWFEIAGIDRASKTRIWETHGAVSGITRQEHRSYFAGATQAFAIRIRGAHRLRPTLALDELPGVKRAPQSFQYLDMAEMSGLLLSHVPPLGGTPGRPQAASRQPSRATRDRAGTVPTR